MSLGINTRPCPLKPSHGLESRAAPNPVGGRWRTATSSMPIASAPNHWDRLGGFGRACREWGRHHQARCMKRGGDFSSSRELAAGSCGIVGRLLRSIVTDELAIHLFALLPALCRPIRLRRVCTEASDAWLRRTSAVKPCSRWRLTTGDEEAQCGRRSPNQRQ